MVYPEQLHNLHNDCTLAAECVEIGNVEKLIPNLNSRTYFVVHYENLNLYERLGLKIENVHRGIKFEESAWLEEYINLNIKLRIEAKQSGNNLDVDFFQLRNNSVFDKTLENIRDVVDIRLTSSNKVAQKLSAKPSNVSCSIFDENLIAVHMQRTKRYFIQPVCLGMSILD